MVPQRVSLVAFALALVLCGCARPADWLQTYPDIAARAQQQPQAVADEVYARWDGLQGMVGSYQVRARRGVSSRTIDVQIYLLYLAVRMWTALSARTEKR